MKIKLKPINPKRISDQVFNQLMEMRRGIEYNAASLGAHRANAADFEAIFQAIRSGDAEAASGP